MVRKIHIWGGRISTELVAYSLSERAYSSMHIYVRVFRMVAVMLSPPLFNRLHGHRSGLAHAQFRFPMAE